MKRGGSRSPEDRFRSYCTSCPGDKFRVGLRGWYNIQSEFPLWNVISVSFGLFARVRRRQLSSSARRVQRDSQ